ncbi:unnamed protein product, partial [Gulo gulo]
GPATGQCTREALRATAGAQPPAYLPPSPNTQSSSQKEQPTESLINEGMLKSLPASHHLQSRWGKQWAPSSPAPLTPKSPFPSTRTAHPVPRPRASLKAPGELTPPASSSALLSYGSPVLRGEAASME